MKAHRAGCWLILLLLAGIQAWAARFYATPDGVSYMDLSDAVLNGQASALFNAYWSPLYPVLIGVLRAVLRPGGYWEFAVAHLLNFLLFAASLGAFEYFIGALRELGRDRWNKPGLSTTWGTVGAYAVFGTFTLMMTPLTLPTPDILVSAASFLAFGALLRLRYDMASRRSAIILGLALACGSLAKSFVIPWAGVCLVTMFVSMRGRSLRPGLLATGIWLVAIVPWVVGLSAKYGHPTFGDTGRLTYVWYVNRVESPSQKQMPATAATPATDSILAGVAMTPDSPGTNPVWYDPARWYGSLRPRFEPARQLQHLGLLGAEYVASLAPVFLVLAFWLIASGPAGAREWWLRTWPVALPAFVALAAYAIVLVTTRYVAPFYMALIMVVMCGARWPDRIPPVRMLLAIGIPLILMVATPDPGRPLAFINGAALSVVFAWLLRRRPAALRISVAAAAGLFLWASQMVIGVKYVWLWSILAIFGYWGAARAAGDDEDALITSTNFRRALVAANAVVVLYVAVFRFKDSLRQPVIEATEPNASWSIARHARAAGIQRGSKIALVGSPFEAYWARAIGASIVAVVPPPSQRAFNTLQPAQRQRLYEEFARAGADFVIVQQAGPTAEMDEGWKATDYLGWIHRLDLLPVNQPDRRPE